MPEQKLFGPIKLSGRALYDDGQMIDSNVINHVTKERLGWIRFVSKMLIMLVSSPCILQLFLQHRQKSFLLIFFFYFYFFQRACSWVLLTTTMRRLTYVTYYVALIGCRSIQLSEEAFFFLVRLKRPIITAQWSSIRLIFWLELGVWQRQASIRLKTEKNRVYFVVPVVDI